MKITCGVFIFDLHNQLLVGHPTGFKFGNECWSIPKGEQDPGEEEIETAVREVREEANIVLDKNLLKYVGRVKYPSGKKTLVAFTTKLSVPGVVLDVKCKSTFPHKVTGLPTLEIDYFDWVDPLLDAERLPAFQRSLLLEAFNQCKNL